MAHFEMELPNEIINQFTKIFGDVDDILGAMTKAGAEVVLNNVKTNAPDSLKKSKIMNCLKMTKTYKTPSDDGINNKVGFYGYFENEDGRKTPAPLVVNVFEYGSTKFQKKPFFRKSFRKEQIEDAMRKAMEKESGGILV